MELIQKQVQLLDQRQIQRLEVLQMSALELRDYLQELSQENPVVDLNEPAAPAEPEREDEQLQHLRWLADNDRQNRYYQGLWDYDSDPIARIGVSGGLEETLSQFIGRQIDRLRLDGETARTVGLLAACLDGDGYFRLDLDELAQDTGIPRDCLGRALEVLRTLEPARVGAPEGSGCPASDALSEDSPATSATTAASPSASALEGSSAFAGVVIETVASIRATSTRASLPRRLAGGFAGARIAPSSFRYEIVPAAEEALGPLLGSCSTATCSEEGIHHSHATTRSLASWS